MPLTTMHEPRARGRWQAAGPAMLVGGAVLVATAYVAATDPNEPGNYPLCPTFALTGLYCAGCGSLRAVHALTQLDLAGAWAMNPLMVLGLPILVVGWALWLRREWLGRQRRRIASTWQVWAIFALLLGYSIARNVPALAPWLAP